MIMEIIVGVIGCSFVFLVVYCILTLNQIRKLLTDLRKPFLDLLEHTNELTMDIQKKSEGLDLLFRPLYAMKQGKPASHQKSEKIVELAEYVLEGVKLFGKIKSGIKS